MMWSLGISVCVLTAVAAVAGQFVEVITTYGALRGTRTAIGPESVSVDTFLGIPYAAPPTGNLRFQKPEPPNPWTGIRNATQFGARCPQQNVFPPGPDDPPMDEDCLFLNIYTPTNPSSSSLPVMFFIHGGAYQLGSGNPNGTYLASQQVVAVFINYRINALGFLSTEDAASIGNYGLWDQVQALKWVRDVISVFNGNPNDVTIWGGSAGGHSVSHLVLSAQTRGLFHKAIMMSGVSLSPYATMYPDLDPTPRNVSTRLATRLGCDTGDTGRMVDCLRTKDAIDIANAATDLASSREDVLFRPVPETTFNQTGFFWATPKVILLNDLFANITTIRGVTHDELSREIKVDNDTGVSMEEFEARVMADLNHYYTRTSPRALQVMLSNLIEVYVTDPNITDRMALRQALISFHADFKFVASSVYELQLSTRYPVLPQYFYQFNFRSPNAAGPEWQGVTHGSELNYVLGYPQLNITSAMYVPTWTEEDKRVSDDMVAMWTSFAKYGNPTPNGLRGVTWLPWTNVGRQFLNINSSVAMESYPKSPQDVWDIIYGGVPANPDDDKRDGERGPSNGGVVEKPSFGRMAGIGLCWLCFFRSTQCKRNLT